ncbi:ROK family protein [Leucobacter sp. gxy201]|uniref:ROK family protein n=1 Tax=Leucobacter sp. gxy201 TaxID=2957200 RepID=UPI003DA0CC12
MNGTVLAIDIGGTKTLVGLVDRAGSVLLESEQTTRPGAAPEAAVEPGSTDEFDRAFAFGCEFAASAGVHPVAVAAGAPEYVAADGTVSTSEVLTWQRQPAESLLRRATQAFSSPSAGVVPAVLDSDVRLGALGELRFGAGRGLGSFLYVSLGTGLSSTLVIDGRPWAGARGQAIALGERVIGSGANLESFASGTALTVRYEAETGERLPGPELVRRANSGDHVAAEVLRTAGEALGDAFADALELLDPGAIIVGGGLGSAETPVMDAARARYESRAVHRAGGAPLITATCGKRSALLGAAARAWGLVQPA